MGTQSSKERFRSKNRVCTGFTSEINGTCRLWIDGEYSILAFEDTDRSLSHWIMMSFLGVVRVGRTVCGPVASGGLVRHQTALAFILQFFKLMHYFVILQFGQFVSKLFENCLNHISRLLGLELVCSLQLLDQLLLLCIVRCCAAFRLGSRLSNLDIIQIRTCYGFLLLGSNVYILKGAVRGYE